jgi:hypothetical protein
MLMISIQEEVILQAGQSFRGERLFVCSVQQTSFDEAAVPLFSHDDVIQDTQVDGARSIQKGARELTVFRGRLGVTAGVIVDEDDAGGMVGERFFHDPPGVDGRAVYRPFLDDFEIQDPIFCVQEYEHENFMGKPGQFYTREIQDRLGRREDIFLFHLLGQIDCAKIFNQTNQSGGDGTDIGHFFHGLRRSIQNTGKTPKAFDQIFGVGFYVYAGYGIREEEFEDFIVVHPGGAVFMKASPQPFAVIEIAWLLFHFRLRRGCKETRALFFNIF